MSLSNIKKIWIGGELKASNDALVHCATNTLHYGLGVFEGIRSYSHNSSSYIFRLDDHIARLFDSALIMNMNIPYTQDEVKQAIKDTLLANNLREAYIKPMVYLGSETLSLDTRESSVNLMVLAWDAYNYADGGNKGIAMNISSFTRHHVNVSMTKAKANGNYLNSQLALREAKNCNVDDVFLLDTEGYVCEATGANVFMIKNGVLYTPPLSNCLNGITRQTIITLAQDKGVKVVSKRLTRDELYIADEVFITGTAAEVLPVYQIDSRYINNGNIGELSQFFMQEYQLLVRGRVPQYIDWNSKVNIT
ncbi:branched-chain amino acid transaminase [Pseudoalteromonas luteoviolacea]|uniref:branched-chain amino acid transaminase n=1 Tax=Pseudoalteromonas luteoviolacea TaxID=43657 RepID=UPI001EECFFDB|nr:branched-chain amino acid transaminase [Pseudoalteromonas luteoviolacea]